MSSLEQQRKANIIQFKDAVEIGLQQKNSVLSPYVQTKSYNGEKASILQVFNPTEAKEVPDIKLPPTMYNETPQDRRYMTFKNYSWAEVVNPFVNLEQDINPFPLYAKSAVYAFNRLRDEVIMRGMLGKNKKGKDGGEDESFLESNIIKYKAVKAGTSKEFKDTLAGLLIEGQVMMADNDVDIDAEFINVLVPPAVYKGLFNIEQVTSKDYVNKANLDAGRVRYFAGVNIILYNRVPGDSRFPKDISIAGADFSKNYYCPMWCSSAVEFGWWKNVEVSYDKLPQYHNAQQLLATASFGASRLEPKKIICLEVPKAA